MHRIMSLTLALVAALSLGFIGGTVAASADGAERTHDRHAAMLDVLAGDYGPSRTELTSAEFDALLDVYGASEQGLPCRAVAAELLVTHDFTPDMRPCLGEEDSPAVGVLLGQ